MKSLTGASVMLLLLFPAVLALHPMTEIETDGIGVHNGVEAIKVQRKRLLYKEFNFTPSKTKITKNPYFGSTRKLIKRDNVEQEANKNARSSSSSSSSSRENSDNPNPSGSGCMEIPIVARVKDIEAGETASAVGQTDNFPVYSSVDASEPVGNFVSETTLTTFDGSDCIFTGALSFDFNLEVNGYASQLSVVGSCANQGNVNAVTGGTGRYACATGYQVVSPPANGYIESVVYVCGTSCFNHQPTLSRSSMRPINNNIYDRQHNN